MDIFICIEMFAHRTMRMTRGMGKDNAMTFHLSDIVFVPAIYFLTCPPHKLFEYMHTLTKNTRKWLMQFKANGVWGEQKKKYIQFKRISCEYAWTKMRCKLFLWKEIEREREKRSVQRLTFNSKWSVKWLYAPHSTAISDWLCNNPINTQPECDKLDLITTN